MTTAVSSSTSTGQTSAAQNTAASSASATEDRFLKLLVAQMKNQDPLNPLDNAAVTSQMAQLSTVTGIEKLNATLQAQTQAQSFQSVSMIGRTVLATGDTLALKNGVAAGGFELAKPADAVKVSVLDSSGNVVRELDAGASDSGVSVFSWDGKKTDGTVAADGDYTFAVKATAKGEKVAASSLAVGSVSSVLMDATGTKLSVSGLGLVGLSDIRQVM
jgi:flagellar basal-body rod modification protein FlgD